MHRTQKWRTSRVQVWAAVSQSTGCVCSSRLEASDAMPEDRGFLDHEARSKSLVDMG